MLKSKQQNDPNERQRPRISQKNKLIQTQFNSDFQQGLKCDQTFDQINNYILNDIVKKDDQEFEQCFLYMKKNQNQNDQDAEQRRRQKRREYKKRQKLKIQQKKQQALKDLANLIAQLYALKTDGKKQIERIQNCLNLIQKNQVRFYQFINAVIRQQVEAIKKQMRICLSQLAADPPNFSKVPRLYEQFVKVSDASEQVEFIINYFNKIMAQKKKQVPSFHRDLDKQTFKYLLNSDHQNRQYFAKVKTLVLNDDIKYQRQKQMLKIMIHTINQKKLKSQYYSQQNEYHSDASNQEQYSQNQEQNQTCYSQQQGNYSGNYQNYRDQYYNQDYPHTQNTTKSSQKDQDDQGYFQQYDQNQKSNGKNNKNSKRKRKNKNKNIKAYQVSFEKTYQTLLQLEKTLNSKKEQKLPCNIDQDWLQTFKLKFLKPKKSIKGSSQLSKSVIK